MSKMAMMILLNNKGGRGRDYGSNDNYAEMKAGQALLAHAGLSPFLQPHPLCSVVECNKG